MPAFRSVRSVATAVATVMLLAGCGGSGSSPTASTTADTSAYRTAVNAVFDGVVAARGEYEAAQSPSDLRRTALGLARADQAGVSKLRGMEIPASASELNSQLATALKAQAAALKTVLAGSNLDTGKLGDAVLKSNDAERVVNQINALP